jgi:hypothetical protein
MMKTCFYLSFVHKGEDKDEFAGACLIEADDEQDAIVRSWRLAINPGGEVLVWAVPESARDLLPHNRLMSRAELEQYGPTHRMGDWKQYRMAEPHRIFPRGIDDRSIEARRASGDLTDPEG